MILQYDRVQFVNETPEFRKEYTEVLRGHMQDWCTTEPDVLFGMKTNEYRIDPHSALMTEIRLRYECKYIENRTILVVHPSKNDG